MMFPNGATFTVAATVTNPEFTQEVGNKAPYDVGVITLATPVPSSVAVPMRVHVGTFDVDELQSQFDNYRIAGTSFNGAGVNCDKESFWGCGELTYYTSTCVQGSRAWRFGPLSDIALRRDGCGSLFEGTCWDSWILTSNAVKEMGTQETGTAANPGDSGGPLVARKVSSGQDQLIGVISGWAYDCDYGLLQNFPMLSRSANFLNQQIPGLMADADLDGIADAADNCINVANPSQANGDGDTFGDACDLCPTVTDQAQLDQDKDKTGDACDPCPTSVEDGDFDVDGVADGCDNCRNIANTNQSDIEADGLGDACDPCPTVSSKNAWNNNDIAEQSELVSVLPDACDPTPLMVFNKVEYPTAIAPNTPDPNRVDFGAYSWLGKTNDTDGSSFATNVKYAACHCVKTLDGTQLSDALCRSADPTSGANCTTLNPLTAPGTKWKTTLTLNQGAHATSIPATYTAGVEGATSDGFTWNWRTDFNAGRFPGAQLISTPSGTIMPALFLSEAGAPTATVYPAGNQPRQTAHNLRDTYEYVKAGDGKVDAPYVDVPPKQNIVLDCSVIDCSPMLFDPSWFIYPELKWRDKFEPSILLRGANQRLTAVKDPPLRSPNKGIDLTARMSTAVATLLNDTTRRFALPVESGRVRRTQGDPRMMAVLPATFDQNTVPTVLRRSSSGLVVESGPAAQPPSVVPAPRQNYFTMLSSTDNSIYLIGGESGGKPVPGAWRFGLTTQRWDRLFNDPATMPGYASIKAATFRPATHDFVVLEVGESSSDGRGQKNAVLLSYNFFTGTRTQLASWSYSGTYQRLYLSVLDDGQLALTTVGASSYQVCRLRILRGSASVNGIYQQSGNVIATPVMGYNTLFVPVARGELPGMDQVTSFPATGSCAL